jgi:hypothetical protein
MSNASFFPKHAGNLLVVNGLNMQTNNHDRGVITTWSGRGDGGYPNFAALVAATKAPSHPLTFISSGGYDGTGDLIPVTRLNSVSSFRKLAAPNRVNPTDPNSTSTYVAPATYARVQAAQQARLAGFKAPSTCRASPPRPPSSTPRAATSTPSRRSSSPTPSSPSPASSPTCSG